MLKRFYRLVATTGSVLLIPSSAYAAVNLKSIVTKGLNDIATVSGYSPNPEITFYDIIGSAISLALAFVGIIFVIVTLYGGIQWMTAAGNSDKVTEAQHRIRNGVLGAIIVFAAYAITAVVMNEICGITGV